VRWFRWFLALVGVVVLGFAVILGAFSTYQEDVNPGWSWSSDPDAQEMFHVALAFGVVAVALLLAAAFWPRLSRWLSRMPD
jgi:predicted anti-sigma-YlaC factor YlaD